MAVISISRGSFSKGKEVAEMVAARLGYRCLSREVILDASEHYHIPEIKMTKAIHDAPSILERFGHDKTRFVTYYQSALVRNVQKDNVRGRRRCPRPQCAKGQRRLPRSCRASPAKGDPPRAQSSDYRRSGRTHMQ